MSDLALDYYSMSMVNTSNDVRQDTKQIKVAALRLLAAREHSRLELLRKLSQKFSAVDGIQKVLDQLQEQGYQSDSRFTEAFIRKRSQAGNGPFKIKIELREKGVCESAILSAFDRSGIDWLSVAEKAKNKRFGRYVLDVSSVELVDQESKDTQEIAKQVRFLKNKGFYQEHIDQVVFRHG